MVLPDSYCVTAGVSAEVQTLEEGKKWRAVLIPVVIVDYPAGEEHGGGRFWGAGALSVVVFQLYQGFSF